MPSPLPHTYESNTATSFHKDNLSRFSHSLLVLKSTTLKSFPTNASFCLQVSPPPSPSSSLALRSFPPIPPLIFPPFPILNLLSSSSFSSYAQPNDILYPSAYLQLSKMRPSLDPALSPPLLSFACAAKLELELDVSSSSAVPSSGSSSSGRFSSTSVEECSSCRTLLPLPRSVATSRRCRGSEHSSRATARAKGTISYVLPRSVCSVWLWLKPMLTPRFVSCLRFSRPTLI
jgi:LSD1 subclass zinc finger protein